MVLCRRYRAVTQNSLDHRIINAQAREGIPFAYMGRKRAAAARTAFFEVFGSEMGQQATHEKVTHRIYRPDQLPPDQNQPEQ
jgi:hypothetical protein